MIWHQTLSNKKREGRKAVHWTSALTYRLVAISGPRILGASLRQFSRTRRKSRTRGMWGNKIRRLCSNPGAPSVTKARTFWRRSQPAPHSGNRGMHLASQDLTKPTSGTEINRACYSQLIASQMNVVVLSYRPKGRYRKNIFQHRLEVRTPVA